jgi:hypothetical protein
MLESKSSALPLGDAPPGSPRIKPAGPRRKPAHPSAKCPAKQGFWGRLRGWGGIVIRTPPEARGNPFALVRRVAQPGRALRSGRRGRRFESSLSDQFFNGLAPLLPMRPPCVGNQWEFRRCGGSWPPASGTAAKHGLSRHPAQRRRRTDSRAHRRHRCSGTHHYFSLFSW